MAKVKYVTHPDDRKLRVKVELTHNLTEMDLTLQVYKGFWSGWASIKRTLHIGFKNGIGDKPIIVNHFEIWDYEHWNTLKRCIELMDEYLLKRGCVLILFNKK